MNDVSDYTDSGHVREANFPKTRWTIVRDAGAASTDKTEKALEQLCRRYWYPIYVFVRRQGYSPDDAQDLTQEFFARLLKKPIIAAADPGKGKFRSFLLGTLKHFLADERDKRRAEKRGGKCTIFSLDQLDPEQRYALEPATDVTPETLFHRKWAMTILENAVRRLQEQLAGTGNSRDFELLKEFLTSDPERSDYERLAARLHVKTNTIAVRVFRLREQFKELIREEIADTVSTPEQLDEETKVLFP